MKDYPLDKVFPFIVWPMTKATRVKNKLLKIVFVLLYFPWFVLMLPVIALALPLSIAMVVWDDVNEEKK